MTLHRLWVFYLHISLTQHFLCAAIVNWHYVFFYRLSTMPKRSFNYCFLELNIKFTNIIKFFLQMNKLIKNLTLGVAIHRIVKSPVDTSSRKDDKLKLVVPADLYTVETVIINELKTKAVQGGTNVISINGGKDNAGREGVLIFNPDKTLEHNTNRFIEVGPKEDAWFGDYEAVCNLCNAINQAEIERLEAVELDILGQIDALKGVKKANELRAAELKILNVE